MKRWPVMLWLAALVFSAWIVAQHTRIATDMAAFLPDTASPAQQLMVDQLREGVAARVVMLALEDGDPAQLALSSRKFAQALEASDHFGYVRNGTEALSPRERELLMRYRYLLSPATDAAHFSRQGLRQSLQQSLQLLASPAGAMVRNLLPADPGGEMLALLESWGGAQRGPQVRDGVWFSKDGKRALLLAETKAAGFDIDAQQQVQDAIRHSFEQSRSGPQVRLLMSGPSVFAVESRNRIHNDAWRLSLMATALVAVILLAAYGSPRLWLLGMLPVASGALVGVAAVSLGYGTVHGITMGFGATLIGEAVDYPTYLFTQRAPDETLRQALARVWPTLRLAVLTTVFGSLTMLLSGFTGLSQLGAFSLVGVLTAGLVTRFVLPEIAPGRFDVAERHRIQDGLAAAVKHIAGLRWAPFAALLLAALYLAARGGALWENDLAKLSPIAPQAQQLDQSLRDELGAPDVRYLLAVPGRDRDQALRNSERLAPRLQALAGSGAIAGFDYAARIVPSAETQAARRAALPDADTLRRNLNAAVADTPFRPDIFAPFLHGVAASRDLPPLTPEDWAGTPLGSLARGLLVRQKDGWVALVSLRGVRDPAALDALVATPDGIDTLVAAQRGNGAFVLDIKSESERMITRYRDQSLRYSLFGVAAIVAVLGFGLRNFRAVFSVMLPVSAAIAADAALLAAFGVKLSLFHIVSLLLVLGIGLNYGLFLALPASNERERRRALFSVLVCVAATMSAFGALALSSTPVLRAIGGTVALGAALSLLFAAMWAKHPNAE